MITIIRTVYAWKPNQSISNVLKSIYGVGETRSKKIVCNVTGRYDIKLIRKKSSSIIIWNRW